MNKSVKLCAGLALASILVACSKPTADDPVADAPVEPTETAEEFVARANAELIDLGRELGAASWVRSTYITQDTAIIASAASEKYAKWHSEMVQQAVAYDDHELDASTRRSLDLLKLGTSAPAPNDAAKRKEISEISTEMEGTYGAGKYCRGDDCLSGSELEQLMKDVRDYDELLDYYRLATNRRAYARPVRTLCRAR